MNNINPAAAAAREAARASSGEFGMQSHSTPETGPLTDSPACYSCGDNPSASRGLCVECRAELEDKYGAAAPEVGGRSPWGEILYADEFAPGITVVDTDSHGGMRLSPARNREIPAPLRKSDGWYEEDCEAGIVTRQFPDEVIAMYGRSGYDPSLRDRVTEDADQVVKDWFPDGWEKATGEKLQPGDSFIRDEEAFQRENADNFVIASRKYASDTAFGREAEGKSLASARRDSDGHSRTYLVEKGGSVREPVPAGAEEWSVMDRPKELSDLLGETPKPAPAAEVFNVESMPAGAADDLNKLYQDDDGVVRSFAGVLDRRGGIVGKSASTDSETGRTSYWIEHPDGTSTSVTARLWRSAGVDDQRSETSQMQDVWAKATAKYRKLADTDAGLAYRSQEHSKKLQDAKKGVDEASKRLSESIAARAAADNAERERISNAGPVPGNRFEFMNSMEQATTKVQESPGSQQARDRYVQLRKIGEESWLFRK